MCRYVNNNQLHFAAIFDNLNDHTAVLVPQIKSISILSFLLPLCQHFINRLTLNSSILLLRFLTETHAAKIELFRHTQ